MDNSLVPSLHYGLTATLGAVIQVVIRAMASHLLGHPITPKGTDRTIQFLTTWIGELEDLS